MGEPTCGGLGSARAAGQACVVWVNRLRPEHVVVVGCCSAGSPGAGVCGACVTRAVALGEVHTAWCVVG
jgi:hypothetical protein